MSLVYRLTCMRFSVLKLVKFSFPFFLLFAIGFITPVNKYYQKIIVSCICDIQHYIYSVNSLRLRQRFFFVRHTTPPCCQQQEDILLAALLEIY